MSKARVIVLSVVHQGLTKAEAARKFDVSWQWVHTLVTRYETGGLDALEPRSHRPPLVHRSHIRTGPDPDHRAAPAADRQRAGCRTGHDRLAPRPGTCPSPRPRPSAASSTPPGRSPRNPKNRPKSSYLRFEADQPNETWQSDFTHWPLADGTDVEILNWLDDHSRLLLSCTAHDRVTGTDVITTTEAHGLPASTLTDNGLAYTARFRGSRDGFECLLAALTIEPAERLASYRHSPLSESVQGAVLPRFRLGGGFSRVPYCGPSGDDP